MKKKLILVLAAVIAVTLMLGACGSGSTSNGSSPSPGASENVTPTPEPEPAPPADTGSSAEVTPPPDTGSSEATPPAAGATEDWTIEGIYATPWVDLQSWKANTTEEQLLAMVISALANPQTGSAAWENKKFIWGAAEGISLIDIGNDASAFGQKVATIVYVYNQANPSMKAEWLITNGSEGTVNLYVKSVEAPPEVQKYFNNK